MRRDQRTLASLLALLALAGGALAAEPPAPTEPATGVGARVEFPAAGIRLEEALRLTLDHNPAIRLAWTQAQSDLGGLLDARGFFDLRGEFFIVHEFSKGELLPSQIERERQRRDFEISLSDEFGEVADDLERQLDEGDRRPAARCRSRIIIINGVNVCVSDVARSNDESFLDFLDRLIAQEDDPGRRDRLREIRDDQEQLFRELAINTIIELRRQISSSQGRLERLGDIPAIQERSSLLFDMRLTKPTRSGISVSGGLIVEGVEDNFDDKALQAADGGKGIPNTFASFVGLSLEVPLGKGRGKRSVAAAERGSELIYKASLHQAAHSLSEQALGAYLAYLDDVAGRERQALLEEAVAIEEELLRLAEQLVEAGELPRTDLSRVRARVASARAAATTARRDRHEARVRLANAMGVAVTDRAAAPTAADPFPAAPEVASWSAERVAGLIRDGVGRRGDVEAAKMRREAARILLGAAERDLERRFDLTVSAGYSGLHESFDDDFYDPSGFSDALTGDLAGLSVFFTLTTEVPFRNRISRGQLAQSLATAQRSDVLATDLERRIRLRLAELARTLEHAAAALDRQQQALALQRQTLETTLERFRAGETTLIDTILTEEQLTFAALDVVAARQRVAALAAQLQFESGGLIDYRIEDNQVLVDRLNPYAADS